MFKLQLRLLSIALAGAFSTAALAQLPAPIKPGHPRLFTSQAGIDNLKAQLPLVQKTFPAAVGSISLTVLPKTKGSTDTADMAIFGKYIASKNGIFLRHIDSWEVENPGKVAIQVGLMKANGTYLSYNTEKLLLNPDVWATISVAWNNVTHSVSLTVTEGGATRPVPMKAWPEINGVFTPWQADQQEFVFSGRKDEEIKNVEVRGATPDAGFTIPLLDKELSVAYYDFIRLVEQRLAELPNCRLVAPAASPPAKCDLATGHRLRIVDLAQQLALAYHLSGDERYLTGAYTYADMLMSVELTAGNEWSMGGRVGALGMLYDWLYAKMDAPRPSDARQTYLAAIAARIKETIAASTPRVGDDLDTTICGAPGSSAATAVPFTCNASNLVYENWSRTSGLPSISQYYIGGHQFSAVTGIALGLLAIAEEHGEVMPMIETAYKHFDKGFLAARAHISVDGGHHMGWAYGVSSIPERVQMWRSALGESAAGPIFAGAWQSQLIYPYIYGLRNTKSYVSGGDSLGFPASGDTFDTRVTDDFVSNLALWAALEGDDANAWSFHRDHIQARRSSKASLLLERLYWPGAAAATRQEDLPLARYFRNSGQVVMRDSWDYNAATLLEFKSSTFASENHQHLDQNSFSLYYKAPLLLDSGLYESYGSSHWQNYYTRSVAHNTITVFNPAEKFLKGAVEYSNDGGQWFPSPNTLYPTIEEIQVNGTNYLRGIDKFESAPSYAYTTGDASLAYSADKLERVNGFVRSVLFLNAPEFAPRKPVTIVFDNVRSKSAPGAASPFPASFLLHTANEPEAAVAASYRDSGQYDLAFANAAARIVTIRNGAGLVTAQTLLPVNAKVSKTGGNRAGQSCAQFQTDSAGVIKSIPANGDCRFTARGKDASGNLAWFNYVAANSEQQTSDADVGAWRLEVSAPAPAASGATQHFLHVLSVGDNTGGPATPAAAALLSSDANSAALLLGAAAEKQLTVLFNRSPQIPSTLLQWTSPTANADVIATGVKPGATFTLGTVPSGNQFILTLEEATGPAASYVSSTQGVLHIVK